MRYAVISDIHANVWALEAVLNDIERHGVDAILQLGDVLYGPLAPQATYACLQAASIPVLHIKGNQDDEIVQAAITGASQAAMDYVLDDLSAEAWHGYKPYQTAVCRKQKCFVAMAHPLATPNIGWKT